VGGFTAPEKRHDGESCDEHEQDSAQEKKPEAAQEAGAPRGPVHGSLVTERPGARLATAGLGPTGRGLGFGPAGLGSA
jgi:hypothetical protein